jgi:hypothetical protein
MVRRRKALLEMWGAVTSATSADTRWNLFEFVHHIARKLNERKRAVLYITGVDGKMILKLILTRIECDYLESIQQYLLTGHANDLEAPVYFSVLKLNGSWI